MFEPEWIEYFQREAPFSYYCILLLQWIGTLLFYSSYVILLFIGITPIFMIYSGTKSIKIKLIESKEHKKIRKQKEEQEKTHENLYLDCLDKNLKKKKKHS
jgi:predicted membrane protein